MLSQNHKNTCKFTSCVKRYINYYFGNISTFYEKEFIPIKAWIVRKNLVKNHCQIRIFIEFKKHRRHRCWLQTCKKSLEWLWIKKSWWLSYLYVQKDTLLLANILENVWNKCKIETYPQFLSVPGFMVSISKKTNRKRIINWY